MINSDKQEMIENPWLTNINRRANTTVDTILVLVRDGDNSKMVRLGAMMDASL